MCGEDGFDFLPEEIELFRGERTGVGPGGGNEACGGEGITGKVGLLPGGRDGAQERVGRPTGGGDGDELILTVGEGAVEKRLDIVGALADMP